MAPKQESAVLKEMQRIYQSSEERAAIYTRRPSISLYISWMLIFVAFLLGTRKLASPMVSLILALVGGWTGGFAILFGTAAKQLPLWVRYTTLRDSDVQQRLLELVPEKGR